MRKLLKLANKIISISNSISNQLLMHVTMDVTTHVTVDVTMHVTMHAANITQSNIQYTVIKIIYTIQFYLVKFKKLQNNQSPIGLQHIYDSKFF